MSINKAPDSSGRAVVPRKTGFVSVLRPLIEGRALSFYLERVQLDGNFGVLLDVLKNTLEQNQHKGAITMTEQNNNEVAENEVVSSEVAENEVVSSEVVSSEVVSSELVETEKSIPLEWVGEYKYFADILWLASSPVNIERTAESRALLTEMAKYRDLAELDIPGLPNHLTSNQEIIEFITNDGSDAQALAEEVRPGWYLDFNVDDPEPDNTLEEARLAVRNMLKSWNLTSSVPGNNVFPAPLWLGKSDRRKLIQEFDQSPEIEIEHQGNMLVLAFFKQFSDTVAFEANILKAIVYTDFLTSLRSDNDPIRTLVGQNCMLSQKDLAGHVNHIPWSILGEGVVAYTDEILSIGDYVLNLSDMGNLVKGKAFTYALWTASSGEYVFRLHLMNEMN
jgi:hypothetical protein